MSSFDLHLLVSVGYLHPRFRQILKPGQTQKKKNTIGSAKKLGDKNLSSFKVLEKVKPSYLPVNKQFTTMQLILLLIFPKLPHSQRKKKPPFAILHALCSY